MKEDRSEQETTASRQQQAPKETTRTRANRPAPRTNIDQGPSAQTAETQQMLNAILADEFVLYVRTLNCHWNVRGMQFHSLHAFFEELYEESFKMIDDLAEKVRSVGGFAMATMEEYLGNSRIKEQVAPPGDPRMMIADLAAGHEAVIKHLREAFHMVKEKFDDPSTENFVADLLEKHEKVMWMLQTHLDRELE
jgi:starvation-inducible DNA-binding protein